MFGKTAAIVLALALCGSSWSPQPCAALELTPFVGAVIPTKNMLISSGTYIRIQTHTVYGLSVSTALTGPIALELAGAVGTGKMEIVSTEAFDLASSLLLVDARARVRMVGGEQSQLALIAGVGYTKFKIGYFDYANDLDDENELNGEMTGLVGLGFRGALGERMRFSVDAMDRIHDTGLDLPSLTGAHIITQHDIMFTAGLTFPLTD